VSISASTTENRPSVNSWSPFASPKWGPASSQKRARTSAVVISSRGFSLMPANAVSVAEEVALREVEAELERAAVGLSRLDLLGEEGDAVVAQALHVGHDVGVVARQQVDLDNADVVEQPRVVLVPGEVVEREHVAVAAELRERVQELVVDRLLLEQLEHDPGRRQRERERPEDEAAGDVQPGRAVADQVLEPDLGERVDHNRRGRLVVVRDHRVVLVRATEEQLVPPQVELAVEDRLACYVDVAQGCSRICWYRSRPGAA
jgi:hypothetical protein